jgi:hypothetical protein
LPKNIVISTKAKTAAERILGYLGPDHEYRTATVATFIFGALYGWLEYYYIIEQSPAFRGALPFSRASEPVFLGFYYYHLFTMLPIFALVAFGPFLDDILFKLRPSPKYFEPRRTLFLGISNTWMAVWIEDIFWFIFRTANPLRGSCLAGKWIQWAVRCEAINPAAFPDKLIFPLPDWLLVRGPEWTARWGFFSLGLNAFPYWYLVTIILLGIAYYLVFYFRKS